MVSPGVRARSSQKSLFEWVLTAMENGVPDDAIQEPAQPDTFIAQVPGARADVLLIDWGYEPTIAFVEITGY